MDKLETYKQASGEIWAFFKSHSDSKNKSDKWWEGTVKEADSLWEKYRGKEAERYASDYLLGCMSEIARLSKEPKRETFAISYVADSLFRLAREYVNDNPEKKVNEIIEELVRNRHD